MLHKIVLILTKSDNFGINFALEFSQNCFLNFIIFGATTAMQ